MAWCVNALLPSYMPCNFQDANVAQANDDATSASSFFFWAWASLPDEKGLFPNIVNLAIDLYNGEQYVLNVCAVVRDVGEHRRKHVDFICANHTI